MSAVEPIPSAAERDVYLKSFLKPFERWLDDPGVTEIMVNRPGEVWIERQAATGFERFDDPNINALLLQRLAVQIARVSHQAINREQPLLAASLPSGERIQIAGPRAPRRARVHRTSLVASAVTSARAKRALPLSHLVKTGASPSSLSASFSTSTE